MASEGEWAGSNIYWDGEKLTFAAYDDPDIATKQYYQGVLFKYGSLTGISPRGNKAWGANDEVFVSDYNETAPYATTWRRTNRSNYSGITSFDIHPDTYDPMSNNAAASVMFNNPTYWRLGYGDICQYLGAIGAAPPGYRLPLYRELLPARTDNGTAQELTNPKADGTSVIDWMYGVQQTNEGKKVILPASGWRNGNGELIDAGKSISAWTGSAASNDNAYDISKISNRRTIAMPVRCIRDVTLLTSKGGGITLDTDNDYNPDYTFDK
jgi:hypothetical protein